MSTATSLLRRHEGEESTRVSMIELFFDLVFVFAVTQVSHALLADMTATGLLRTSVLLVAVWWVWINTTWVTNWLDPERIPVRLCLLALMLAGLLLSASIPNAFAGRGAWFAGAYAFMQIGRTLFFLWAVRGEPAVMTRNFQRILAWVTLASLLWIAGAFMHEDARLAAWALALGIEVVSPWVYFWVPGLGRSTTADWNIAGGHLAERCALFVIIALGESVLVTGATFSELSWTRTTFTSFAVAVLGSILLWWIYFDTGARRAYERIHHSADPGRVGRSAYTYIHVLIVAGIIGCAVSDEVLLLHPDHATNAGYAAILGGPAVYLLGTALFKWVTNDRRSPPLSHLIGLALFCVLAWMTVIYHPSPLTVGAGTVAALAVVAAWESMALRRPARARTGYRAEHGQARDRMG